jgi:hypothetical protein
MHLSSEYGVPFWCNIDMNESTWTDPTKEAQQTLNAAGAGSRDSWAGGTTPSQQKEQQRETAGLKTGVGEFVFS